ncbi:MAG: helix-turn-helix domain-containing protein [Phycicoccus sp.]
MSSTEERVRDVIERSGHSHREFAELVGLDASKLSKSLAGTRRFTSVDLARIGDLGDVSIEWLLGGDEPPLALAARAASGGSTRRAIAEAHALASHREGLSTLGYDQHWRFPTAPARTGTWTTDGARLAAEALGHLAAAGLDPQGPSLAAVVEEGFGIDVAVRDLGTDFDGLSVATATCRLILLGPTAAPFRPRFTLAHELGHLLAADDQGLHVDADIYRLQKTESEVRANAFAAAFLMPEDVLVDAVRRDRSDAGLCALAMSLRVSPSALAVRLMSLRVVDGITADRLKRTSAQKAAQIAGRLDDLMDATTLAAATRPPGLLARDAFAAYQAGDTTLRPYASLIGADVDRLRAALEDGGT